MRRRSVWHLGVRNCARKDTNADVNDRYPVPTGG